MKNLTPPIVIPLSNCFKLTPTFLSHKAPLPQHQTLAIQCNQLLQWNGRCGLGSFIRLFLCYSFLNHTFPVPSNPSPIAHGSRLRDMDDENVLDYLDVCVDFIDKGSVLVHCFAGVSRRSTRIPEAKLRVCLPQWWFSTSAQIYEEMGIKVDRASPIYKSFRLKVLGN
ncbi:hypothetical protein ACE6H2_015513 [Prunus campanulata]